MKKVFLFCFLAFFAAGAYAQTARELFDSAGKETDPAKQIKLYTQAIEKNAKYADAYHYRGDVNKELGKTAAAQKDYTSAVKLKPKSPYPLFSRGVLYAEQGKLALAAEDFSSAVKLKADFSRAYLERAAVYVKQDKYNLALKDLDKYSSLEKRKDPALYLYQGRANLGSYKYDSAQRDLQKYIDLRPEDSAGYYHTGRLFYNRENYDRAISYFSKAVNRNAKDPQAVYMRARAFEKINDYAAAAEDYTKLIELEEDPAHYNKRGAAHEALENYVAAEEDYTKAIALNAKMAAAYNNRAYVYMLSKKWDKAKNDLDAALKHAPNTAETYVNMAGYEWTHKKDKKSAVKNLDSAVNKGFKDFDILHGEGKKAWLFKGLNTTPEFRMIVYN